MARHVCRANREKGVVKPSLSEQIRCIEREIKMRHRVYPGLVDRGKMTTEAYVAEVAAMGAVLQTLMQCAQLADCLEQAERVALVNANEREDGDRLVYVKLTHIKAKQIAAQLRGGSE
jgi:hypothetical protein